MYTLEGFFTTIAPEQRATMIEDGIRVLTRVHAFDWKAAGLDWLIPDGATPTAARQLDVWDEYMQRELRGRTHPAYDRGLAWLRANMPDERPPVLCWGDPRMGNIIWRDDHAACVTDFEAAYIGPADVDLGWWLMFDRWCHESYGAARLPGELTRDEQRSLYEKLSGRTVGDTTWYEVFAALRYTAIVVRVMNRTVERGEMPAEQTVWIDNPATVCLDQLMEENGL
jgi:aminoglycoside phosphotransferase (APT) family kinase protein